MKKDYECVTTIVICSDFLLMVSFSGNMLCTFKVMNLGPLIYAAVPCMFHDEIIIFNI